MMDALTEGRVAHVGARPLPVEDFLAEGRVGGREHHVRRAVERHVRVLEAVGDLLHLDEEASPVQLSPEPDLLRTGNLGPGFVSTEASRDEKEGNFGGIEKETYP